MYIYIQQGEYLKENTKSLHSKITANLTVNFFFFHFLFTNSMDHLISKQTKHYLGLPPWLNK